VNYTQLREYDLASENFQKAYDLRGRVSEREKYRITAYYRRYVTEEMQKANATYELWAQAYPRDWVPNNNLGVNYESMGLHEKALAETLESIQLSPNNGLSYGNLVGIYCRLNRLDEAKAIYNQAVAGKLDNPFLHFNRYAVAFLESDMAEMERQ